MTSEIRVKRGTDSARISTLGIPVSGEPIYATDTKALFVGDGSTDGGVPATAPASLLTLYATTSQDVNALAADNLILWNVQAPAWGGDWTHSTVTDSHKVTINTSGVYELSATLAVDAKASSATRWNGILRFLVNGALSIGAEGKGGYLRDTSSQDETSLHITPFAYEFSSGDYFWLKVDRESSTTSAVDSTARASVLYLKRLR